MAEPDEDVIAPPPRGQGSGDGPARPMVVPPNDAKQLVRQGFFLGLGIAAAFAAISAVLWVVAMILVAAAVT